MKVLVTGGAGFIGSHIVDRLISENNQVVVYDNLSTGKLDFIKHHQGSSSFLFFKSDLGDISELNKAMNGVDFVFHLAAHADVRSGFIDHNIDHQQNLEMTRNVLESMIKNNVHKMMFSSTSSVYGDASLHPTPEDYPLVPTSLYGATKAACESYISAFSSYYNISAYIFRFVSFVGERYTHGLIYDCLSKIRTHPEVLELFSDGSPRKSSLYVGDGVEAIFKVVNSVPSRFNVYNIGNTEVNTVRQVVSWILDEAKATNTRVKWLGKASNWKGDNEFVHLEINKLKSLNWLPETSMEEGVRRTVRYVKNYLKNNKT